MEAGVFYILSWPTGTMETQNFKAEMIISAYYRCIMYPYLNFTTSHLHHIVMHFYHCCTSSFRLAVA